ncbi:IclR family transcriptional regulator [Arthrobacter globiformis]|uniref:IclR family transcriptional regulator n=1 Tax=Arthrobacter globiformis TaxID=1665 RepID=UPI00278F640B|nr:IclR family transcriptional regulator [Arthrobacter globiformis]MDQ0618282.1 DNA-binding IclR family transcriptional regulator [Arthrobacter globiformis]
MAGNNAKAGLSVVSKTVAILGAFSGERTELGLTELSHATGMPTSTVHRLVQELVQCGALERTATGRYVVGLKLWGIASRTPYSYALSDAAMPYLQQLLETTRGHAHLAALHGQSALVLEKLSWAESEQTISRIGSNLPLHATATGQVLLAYAPRALQEEVLAGPLPAFTSRTITDPLMFRRLLAMIRHQAVSRSLGELVPGLDACAAPVFWPDRQIAGSIGSVVVSGSCPPADLEAAVRKAAKGLSGFLESPDYGLGSRALFRPVLRPSHPPE